MSIHICAFMCSEFSKNINVNKKTHLVKTYQDFVVRVIIAIHLFIHCHEQVLKDKNSLCKGKNKIVDSQSYRTLNFVFPLFLC